MVLRVVRRKQRCLVHLENVAQLGAEGLKNEIFSKLEVEKLASRTSRGGLEVATSLGAAAGMTASVTGKVSVDSTATFVPAVSGNTDELLLQLCEEKKVVLVLDEMHRASADLVRAVAELIKRAANRSSIHFGLIVVGTAAESSRLVATDNGISRVLSDVHVPLFSEAESSMVVQNGMERLSIRCDGTVSSAVVKASGGSPSILQFLCLEVAEAACAQSIRTATLDHYKAALLTYVRRNAARFKKQYVEACETVGPFQWRKQTLLAMGHLHDSEFVTTEQIRKEVERRTLKATKRDAVAQALSQLKSKDYQILKTETDANGKAIRDRYVFCEAGMRDFMRLVANTEDEKLDWSGDK